MTFTVAASVASVAAAVPAVGASLALSFVAVGAASQVVAALDIPEPPTMTIEGDTAESIVRSMREVITREITLINDSELRIHQPLAAINDYLHDKQSFIVAERPTLAGATRDNVRSDHYLGYSSD